MKEFQLSDYAWNEPQKKMIREFAKKMKLDLIQFQNHEAICEAINNRIGMSIITQ